MSKPNSSALTQWQEEDLQPIRDKVYSYIKNAILSGEYKAGDRLVERNLAQKLNISRTPIREALFRLESQKFVTTLPRKGVVVNEISRDEIVEVFMILSSLESLAVRLAATKIDPAMIVDFNAEIMELEGFRDELARTGEQDIPVDINLRYNDLIGKASKNIRLHEMLMELKDYVRAFTSLSSSTPGRSLQALNEHLDILTAVRDGQPELAEKYAHIHIEKAKQAYVQSTSVQAAALEPVTDLQATAGGLDTAG